MQEFKTVTINIYSP